MEDWVEIIFLKILRRTFKSSFQKFRPNLKKQNKKLIEFLKKEKKDKDK